MLNKFKINLDIHTLDVISKSSKTLLVRMAGTIIGLIISVYLGRTLGAEGLGIINLVNKIAFILLVLTMFGFDNVIIKYVAVAKSNNKWNNIANTVFTGFWFNVTLAIFIGSLGILFLPFLTESFFNNQALFIPLLIAFLMLLPQTISRVYGAALNGYGKIWQANLVNETLSAFAVGLGLLIIYITNIEVNVVNIILLYAFGRLLVTTSVSIYWKSIFNQTSKPKFVLKPLLKMAIPLLLVASTSVLASNADVIMIGWMANIKDVGLYSVAAKLSLLVVFLLQVTNSVLSPKLAEMYAQNKLKEMNVLVSKITLGLMLVAFGFLLFFIVAGKYMLSLWGIEFEEAYSILIILSIGQFFNVSTGCAGMILIMCGFEKTYGYVSIAFVILNLFLNYFLIMLYGAVGAAISTAITITSENIFKLILAKQKTGILTIPFVKWR